MGSKNPERCAPTLTDSLPLVELVHRFGDWRLSVYCVGCMRTVRFDPRELCVKRAAPATVGEFRARLKCQACKRATQLIVKPVLKRRRER